MKRKFPHILFAAVLVLSLNMRFVMADTQVNSLAPLVEKTAPAVVNIYAQKLLKSRSAARLLDGSGFWRLFRDSLLFGYGKDRIENSLGSGVIVASEGVVVTNNHVVENADDIAVALIDGRVFQAEKLLTDKRTDIAVLRINGSGQNLPIIAFGDSDRIRVGDQVIAIGNPFGLGQTVTSGIVSGLARTSVGVTDFRFFIQTDAAINPGNSGGAQINMEGRLVGINTSLFSTSGGSQGLGFAIPSNMVRTIVESVVQRKPLIRPWIGFSGRSIPPQYARLLGLPPGKGVIITGTYKGGPAEAAGIGIGDVVVSLDGFPVNEFQALRYRIATRTAGSSVNLIVYQQGRFVSVSVGLVAPPDVPAANRTWAPSTSPLRGARVASLSPALAEELGLDSGLSGVVVLESGVGSGASRLGINTGDIIRTVNDRNVLTIDDVLAFQKTPFKPWSMTLTRAEQQVRIPPK
jgi:Do/DeqQ family serine protease